MSRTTLHSAVSAILGVSAIVFVLLLAGVGSGSLTEPPPSVSPYAERANQPGTTTTAAPGTSTTATAATTTGSPETAPPAETVITIEGFAFGEPASAAVGDTVTAVNADGAPHTWTSTDGLFTSGSLRGGESFSFVFDAAGTYDFFCQIHPTMKGSITITP